MRLTSWNINGIRAIDKRGDLDWIWDADHDVVCLQEVKTDPHSLPKRLTAPDGWTALFEPAKKKGYSGVATFVRDGVPCTEIGRSIGDSRFDGEGRIIATDHDAFVLFNIYFPNGRSSPERLQYKLDFYDQFLTHANALIAQGRDVVVCGDFNTAHQDIDVWTRGEWEGVSTFLDEERAFLDRMVDSGFIDTFRVDNEGREGQFTWWDYLSEARADNRGIRIDYFFISEGLEDSFVEGWISQHIMGSDHCPIGLELEIDL